MKLSRNETRELFTKAAAAAGLPYGLAGDLARAGVWLAARMPDAGNAVLSALENLPAAPPMPAAENGALVFNDAAVAFCGVSAFDFLAAKAARRVRLNNADAAPLLFGFVAAAGEEYALATRLTHGDGKTSLSLSDCRAGMDIVIHAAAAMPRAIAAGDIVIGGDALARLQAMAAKTYVPSDARSRESGAGAGLVDND